MNAVIEDLQGQFATLVNDGTIEKLTDMFVDFTQRVSQVGFVSALFGGGDSQADLQEAADTRQQQFSERLARFQDSDKSYAAKNLAISAGNARLMDENTLVQLHKAIGPEAFQKFIIDNEVGKGRAKSIKGGSLDIAAYVASDEFQSKIKPMDDFILRPGEPPMRFNKGDLVMGGTQLGMGGGKIESLLEQLLAETKAGKVIKMDTVTVANSLRRNAIKMNT